MFGEMAGLEEEFLAMSMGMSPADIKKMKKATSGASKTRSGKVYNDCFGSDSDEEEFKAKPKANKKKDVKEEDDGWDTVSEEEVNDEPKKGST